MRLQNSFRSDSGCSIYGYVLGSRSHFIKHLWTVREKLKKDARPAVHAFSNKAFNKHGLLTSVSFGVYICSHHQQQYLEANPLCDDFCFIIAYNVFSLTPKKKWCDCGSQHANRVVEVLSQRQQKVGFLTVWAMVRTDLFLVKTERKCSCHVCEKGL